MQPFICISHEYIFYAGPSWNCHIEFLLTHPNCVAAKEKTWSVRSAQDSNLRKYLKVNFLLLLFKWLQLIYECNPSHGISLILMINAKLLNAHWWCDDFVQPQLCISKENYFFASANRKNYEIKLNYENNFFFLHHWRSSVWYWLPIALLQWGALKNYKIPHGVMKWFCN